MVWARCLRQEHRVGVGVLAKECALQEGAAEVVGCFVRAGPWTAWEVRCWLGLEWCFERQVEEGKWHVDVGGVFAVCA